MGAQGEAGPRAPAARSMRSQTPGTNSGRPPPSPAWWRGSAGHPTSPHTSARRRARDTWEPKPRAPQLAAGAGELAGAHSLRPRAPHPGTGSAPRRRAQAPGALSSSARGINEELRSLHTCPPHQELPTTSLPCFATSQTDRQETQREKGERGEKNYRPSCSHPPAWSRKRGGR